MAYLYYSVLFAVLYVYLGLGLTVLCCPKSLQRYTLVLSPLVGYCYLTLAGWYCYNLDLGGTDVYAPALLFPPLVFFYYAFINRTQPTTHPYRVLNGEVVAALGVGIVTFFAVSFPLVTESDSLTAISIGNNDIASYAAVARYLKEFARSATVGFLGQAGAIYQWHADEAVFGAYLSTAFPSSLFSLETYQLQNVSLYLFFFFSTLVVYSLAREIFRYHQYAAIGIMALYGLSPIMYLTIYQGFLSQTIATGLALCVFLLHVHCMNSRQKFSDCYPYLLLGALFNWGMSVTYPHMLPLVYAPLVAYALCLSVYTKTRAVALHWVSFAAMTIVMTLVLSPSRARALVSNFFLIGGAATGWFVPWISPDTVFGLTLKKASLQPYSGLVRAVLSFPFVVIMILGFVNAYKTDRKLFLLAGSCVGVVLFGYAVLTFVGRAESGWGGYKSYKLLSFFLPLILLGSLIVFRQMEFSFTDRHQRLLSSLFVVLFGCTMFSSYSVVKNMAKAHLSVTQDMVDLQRVEDNPVVESINLRGADWWSIMWQVNFLMRKKLYFEYATYYPASRLDGQWDLRNVRETVDGVLRVAGFDGEGIVETIPVNASYVLKRVGGTGLKAQLGSGWYGPEATHTWTGGDSNSASIVVQSSAELTVDFCAKYWPLNPNNRLSLYLNDAKVIDCPDNNHCQVDAMILAQGQNVLEFRTALPPALPGNGDPRHLGYAFGSIEIKPSRSIAGGARCFGH